MSDFTAEGYNGRASIDGDWLILERKGLGKIGANKGDVRLRVTSVTSVQMRPAGRLGNGYVHFGMPGEPAPDSVTKAGSSRNAVIFTRKQQDAFEGLRRRVESA